MKEIIYIYIMYVYFMLCIGASYNICLQLTFAISNSRYIHVILIFDCSVVVTLVKYEWGSQNLKVIIAKLRKV